MRKMYWLENVPVIICSTDNFLLDEENILKNNATHYYTKPGSVDTLSEILLKIMAKKDLDFLLNESINYLFTELAINQLVSLKGVVLKFMEHIMDTPLL
jgi:CheY-like chemotaxis protein